MNSLSIIFQRLSNNTFSVERFIIQDIYWVVLKKLCLTFNGRLKLGNIFCTFLDLPFSGILKAEKFERMYKNRNSSRVKWPKRT